MKHIIKISQSLLQSYFETEEIPCTACVDEEGVPTGQFDGETCPYCNGTKTLPKKVKKPVETPSDLLKSESLLLKVILPLPKYQKMTQDLQSLCKDSTAGIVNVVVRDENEEIVQAIVKSAFPPASGYVFKGKTFGYGMDASQWGEPSQKSEGAPGVLSELLSGGARHFDKNEIKIAIDQAKEMAKEIAEDSRRKLSADPNNSADDVEQRVLEIEKETLHSMLESTFGDRFNPQAQEDPATDLMVGENGNNTDPIQKLIDGYDYIEKLDEIIQRQEGRLAQMRPHGGDKKENDNFAIAQQMLRKNKKQRAILLESLSPSYDKEVGDGQQRDGSGFLDFEMEADVKKHFQIIKNLTNPYSFQQAGDAQGANPVELFAEEVSRCIPWLQKFARANYGKVQNAAIELANVLQEGDPQELFHNSRLLEEKYKNLIRLYAPTSRQRVMVINNVDTSSLVVKKPQTNTPVFNEKIAAMLRSNFCPTTKRKNRTMVFVSNTPVEVPGIKGVKTFDFNDYPVDTKEAEAILQFFIKGHQASIRMSSEDMAKKGLSFSDSRRIASVLIGKSVKDVLQIMRDSFNRVFDVKTGEVDGRVLYRDVVRSSNEVVMGNSELTDSDNKSHAIFAKPTEDLMDIDEYIRDPNSSWGMEVDKFIGESRKFRNLQMQEETLRVPLTQIESEIKSARSELKVLKESNPEDPRVAELTTFINEKSAEYSPLANQLQKILTAQKACFNAYHKFLIIYGPGSSGKSSFAEAFAREMDFQFYDANMALCKGKFVGDTEHATAQMLDRIFKMNRVIIRLDELSEQLPSNEAVNSTDSAGAGIVQQLLNKLQDNKDKLEERDIWLIGTTNNPGVIRGQIRGRANVLESEAFTNVEGYTKLLKEAVNFLVRRGKTGLLNTGDFINIEDMINETKSLWAGINHREIAQAIVQAGGKVPPRYFHNVWVPDAFDAHTRHLYFKKLKELFENDPQKYAEKFPVNTDMAGNPILIKETGFEMTTENLVRAAQLTTTKALKGEVGKESFSEDEQEVVNGIAQLSLMLSQQREGIKTAQPQEEALQQDYEAMEDEDLDPVFPVQEPQEEAEEEESEDDGENVRSSSSNYYLSALKKSGVISKINKKAQSRQQAKGFKRPSMFGDAKDPNGVPYDEYGTCYGEIAAMLPCKFTYKK